MSSKSKKKGRSYEREVVALFKALGFEAEKAWGSDGRAMGMPADVDIKVIGMLGRVVGVQAKRKRQLPKWMDRGKGEWDIMVMRQDNGETVVMMSWQILTELLKKGKDPLKENATSDPRL